MKEINIKKTNSNQRVDKFIRKYLNDAPLSFIYKCFRKKDIKVNNHWVKQDYILKEGDNLKIYISDEQIEEFNKPKKVIKVDPKLDIVYEDKNLLIINKPSGLLVHGDENEKRITLSNKVQNYLYSKDEFDPNGIDFIPSPCHRLDRNTSGLIIYAKNLNTFQTITELLKEHKEITKTYLALVKGKIDKKGEINLPLRKDEKKGLVYVDKNSEYSKEALTIYEPLIYDDNYTLVKITLITGRTHQIRAHFAYINHPLIGDSKYGDFKINAEFKKIYNYDSQFLIAYKLKFNRLDGALSYLSNKEFIAKIPNKEEKSINSLYIKFGLNKI